MPSKGEVVVEVKGLRLIVYGIGRPKQVELPKDVAGWASNSKFLSLLRGLLQDPSFRRHVTTEGALRSLVMLLYVRYLGVPPYKVAKELGVSHEQLYRMERALKESGVYSMALSWLDLMRSGEAPARR
ncbi:MAG: hypothetical protein ACP5FT_04305 [Acidilobus sp.]